MAAHSWMTPTIWTPQRSTGIATRLVRSYMGAPDEIKELGKQFYPVWNQTAEHLGRTAGLTTEHGAAIMAHISPKNEAELNRIQAMQLVHGVSANVHESMVRAAGHASAAASARGRMRGVPDGSPEHRELAAEVEHHNREVEAIKSRSGLKGTPAGSLGSREFGKASAVILGHHEDPLASLGVLKRRDFGGDIADPHSSRVAIDTQYHDAALGLTDVPYDLDRGLTNANRYEHFQQASAAAHHRVREVTGEDISHPEMMAGIWYNHQLLKASVNAGSNSARKASETKINSIRRNDAFRLFLPETHGLVPAFPKITGR